MARVSRVAARSGGVMSQMAEGSSTNRLVVGGLALAGVAGIGIFGGMLCPEQRPTALLSPSLCHHCTASLARGATNAGVVNDNTLWPKYVQERIASTFTAFGASVVFTGVATVALFNGVGHVAYLRVSACPGRLSDCPCCLFAARLPS